MRPLLDQIPQLNRLAVFEAVAEAGSFTAAARKLGITQPAVSRHITTLESQLGFLLFVRRSNRIDLTPEGESLVEVASQAFSAIEAVLGNLQGFDQQMIVASSTTFAESWLVPNFERLSNFMSPCEVSIVLIDDESLLDEVHHDVAIRHGLGEWAGLRCQKLLPDEVLPATSPKLASELGLDRSSPPTALLSANLIDLSYRAGEWMSWQNWFAGHGIRYDPPAPGVRYYSYTSMVQHAIRGNGIVLCWQYLTASLVDLGVLQQVGAPVQVPHCGHYLTWPTQLNRNRNVRLLLKWFEDVLPPGRWENYS